MAVRDHQPPRIGVTPIAESAVLTGRITALSVAISITLTAAKLAAWLVGGSVALLASLADSALDVAAALATFIAVRVAVSPPDKEHRYGHGKAEAFASLLQAGLVFASAALIAREALARLLSPRPVQAEGWGLAAMGLSLVMTGGLIALQSRVLAKTSSVAVSGDRAHYAADLASNLAAIVGIAATAFWRDPRWDAGAGLFVALWLTWGAIKVLRDATDHLMDHELGQAERQAIIGAVLQDRRIADVHELRTRASGPRIHIQMHVDLDPDMSLDQAHKILVAAERRVLDVFPAADILIHADPEGRAEPHGPFGDEVYELAP
jgi:cation diffusion facilitator family transporter